LQQADDGQTSQAGVDATSHLRAKPFLVLKNAMNTDGCLQIVLACDLLLPETETLILKPKEGGRVMAMWDLLREMETLRREIDNAFTGFGRAWMHPGFLPGLGTAEYPQVNLGEDDDHLYVEALVPGMDPESLELTVMRGTLTLAGERREMNGVKKTWHRNERGTGKFLRTVDLPVEVDADRVMAECRNGMLLVTLPKAEKAKPKKVAVKVG
jgi:HSP20 family protein